MSGIHLTGYSLGNSVIGTSFFRIVLSYFFNYPTVCSKPDSTGKWILHVGFFIIKNQKKEVTFIVNKLKELSSNKNVHDTDVEGCRSTSIYVATVASKRQISYCRLQRWSISIYVITYNNTLLYCKKRSSAC